MPNKLSWLHISDIHFYPKNEWRDNESRKALLVHLKEVFSSAISSRPDFVFCTGDIAFGKTRESPLSEQYTQAKSFFDELLIICGNNNIPLPRERLFVVPGNHDINRGSINSDAQAALNNFAATPDAYIDTINRRFNDRTKEFKDTITRLDEYSEFVKDYLPHQYDVNGRHYYAHIVELDGLKVGISGFNSAWTCSGPEDDRNIWLAAEWQFNEALRIIGDVDVRIGLIHHPTDWLNAAERDITKRRISSDFDFWLHGHNHNAWVTPVQSYIEIAAGAVGAKDSDEFGINLTSLDLVEYIGTVNLYNKTSNDAGWKIAPISPHAPIGQWVFDLPSRMRGSTLPVSPPPPDDHGSLSVSQSTDPYREFVDRYLTRRLEVALQSFSLQPKVWINPVISTQPEIARDAKSKPTIDLNEFAEKPKSAIIKAPPQYGLTCLALYLARESWRNKTRSFWLYLNAKNLKPFVSSINDAVSDELANVSLTERDIRCVILDSWNTEEKDAYKLLNNLSNRFENIPIICMQQDEGFPDAPSLEPRALPRQFDTFYLWALPREQIRSIVAAYNEVRYIGDEDAVTSRLVSDLDVLNLHRTPLNCLTLLKVSEVDFDESPVNRSEIIKRVLFLLFCTNDIPTYKSRPDLKDCQYVLGYFCEQMIRGGIYYFTRDKFLHGIQECCNERLIYLETHVVFDVLYANNILIKRGSYYTFRFSYWIFYFAAHRMHHDQVFADYILSEMRYAQHPEIIEFYTGIDRRREDALRVLITDIDAACNHVKKVSGVPDRINPYRFGKWIPSPDAYAQMQQEISTGVLESNLPAAIKDRYADRDYDHSRPYDQKVGSMAIQHSFVCMINTMRAGARALRNSDYVSPGIKRQLLRSILECWEEASKVLFILLPILAMDRCASFDGTGFVLNDSFSESPKDRLIEILNAIPANVVSWCQNDLFSKKMGPLFIDQLSNRTISDIIKHELILLLILHRPHDWGKHVQHYIANNAKNSFYLFDVYRQLRAQYRYGFASQHTLKDIENLIMIVATKHITGERFPGAKSIKKVHLKDDIIPPREV